MTTGVVLDAAMVPFNTSEWQLSRQLYAGLTPDDVVVADSAYGTYADLALVKAVGADGVFRKHHARHCDFRRGKKLGIGDHRVVWHQPQTSKLRCLKDNYSYMFSYFLFPPVGTLHAMSLPGEMCYRAR